MLTTLQKAAQQLDADLRQFNTQPDTAGKLVYQKSVANTLLLIANFIGKEVLNSPIVYTTSPDDGSNSSNSSSFPVAQLEITEGKNLLEAGYTDDAVSAYRRAMASAAGAIMQSRNPVAKPDWKTFDTTLTGMADCLMKFELEMPVELDLCALVCEQQTQGRKTKDVFDTRIALSRMYLQEYKHTGDENKLWESARHGEIASEMGPYTCQPDKDIDLLCEDNLAGHDNFRLIVQAAPLDTPASRLFMRTYASTVTASLARQFQRSKNDNNNTEPSRH